MWGRSWLGGGGFPDFDGFVEGIALDGGEAGFADGLDHVLFCLELGSGGSGHVEDMFFADGAVEVIGTEAEGDLGEFEAHSDPIGGDMGDIIEVEAADGEGAEGVGAGGGAADIELVIFGLVGEGDEAGEALGLVLQLAEVVEVIDAVFERFEVAVEHGAGATTAELVPLLVEVEPFLGGFFAAGDGFADFGAEDFGAAAGEGVEPGFFEGLEDLGDWEFSDAGEVEDFDGGEAFELELGADGFEGFQHIGVVGEGEGGVEAADDMEFCDSDLEGFAGFLDHFIDGEFEAVLVTFFAGEGAELATEDAVIGVIDVAVDDIAGAGVVTLAVGEVGEAADGGDIGVLQEEEGVLFGDALAGVDFIGDGAEDLAD